MRKILFCIIVAFVYSCTDNEQKGKTIRVSDFAVKKELKATVMETDTIILAPDRLFILNDQLWLLQRKDENFFSVFSLPDCKYLYSTGTLGRGPNEFMFPMGSTIHVEDDKTFTILDDFIFKTLELSEEGSLITKSKDQIFELLPINGFMKLNDSLFCAFADCATGTASDFEYRMANINSKEEVKFSSYPQLAPLKPEKDDRCQIYYKNLVAHPQGDRFASFYTFFKYFRIHDANKDIEKEVFVEIEPYKSDMEKRTVFYAQPYSSDKYIYVPCFSNEIQVWDWEGKPIALFSIDRKFFCYAIDEKRQKIYVVASNEDSENKIYVYDMDLDN